MDDEKRRTAAAKEKKSDFPSKSKGKEGVIVGLKSGLD